MKIFGSRKTLLFKTAGVGLIMTTVSFLLLYINGSNTEEDIQRMIRSEARDYYKSIEETISTLTKFAGDHAAEAFERQGSNGTSRVLADIRREMELDNFGSAFIWYTNGERTVYEPRGENSEVSDECHRFFESGLDDGIAMIGNQPVRLICRQVGRGNPGTLLIGYSLGQLYSSTDRDKRIRIVISPEVKQGSSKEPAISIPLATIDGNIAGSIEISPRTGMPTDWDLSKWEVFALGILPLLSFILVSYLLYRYFEAFAGHSSLLRGILKTDKPGVEIFRRSHLPVKSDIPEFSEIFSLVDESLKEKGNLDRSLAVINAALSIMQEKGNDQAASSELVELIVNAADFFGGAIFSFDQGDERVEIIGKYNFNDILLTGLVQSAAGRNFIKYIQKRNIPLAFSGDDFPEESGRKLFEGFQHVEVIPLMFKARFEGLLVLTSLNPVSESGLQSQTSKALGELLGSFVHGIGIEREKLARYDKTIILQETSLAISSKLDLPSVLQVVAGRLTDFADATYCMILLNTDVENMMEVASFHTKRQQGISISNSASVNIADLPRVAEAMTSKRALILNAQELGEMPEMERRFFHTDSIRLLTILPISHSAQSFGAVILGEERSRPRASAAADRLSFVQAIVSQAASAIDNARLYAFINSKVDQLTALQSAGAAIYSEINSTAMLEKVLAAFHDYLHYSIAAVFIIDERSGCLRPAVINSGDSSRGTDKIHVGAGDTAVEKAAQSGESQLIEDFRLEAGLKPSLPGFLSELAVPIKLGGKNLGVLTIGSQEKRAFVEAHENFLRTLAGQIAMAMERTRLFDQERERGIKLNTIFEFSKKLSKSLNIHEVVQIAVDSIREAFAYPLVAVFLHDQARRQYSMEYQASAGKIRLPDDCAVAENHGLLGAAIESRKTVHCSDVTAEPDYLPGANEVKSEVCIPIIVGEKILGVLDVESMEYDSFTAEDINTLEALADIMAVAINNSQLFEESIQKAERLSLIDNINKAISATLDLDSFFRVVAKAVADNAGYRWTCLVVPDGGSFIFKAGYTPKSAGVISTESMLEMLQDKLAAVIRSSRPEFVTFSQLASMGAPEKLQSVVDAGIRNLALFPIGDNTRTEAVMIIGSAHSDDFSSQELQLLKDLAIHLRIAWQNAQLFKELKTAYEQLQEAQERMVETEKLRALGEMSSGVVHDFNNILAAILGRLQIVSRKLSGYSDWDGRQFLQRNLELIEKAANDGSGILARISEFTKKNPSEKFVEIYLDQIINDTIELTRPRWHDQTLAGGKTINIEFRRQGNLQTSGNPTELREVFVNLINNSVDAINGDGRIIIDARLISDKEIRVMLEDNGSGMSAETRNKIFEPFFTTKGAKGTGLGLSVTYGIIARHKGSIKVDSELGRGTKFIITLPVIASQPAQTKTPVAKPGQPRKLLIVDDDEAFREVLAGILSSSGHEADTAADASTALEMLGNKKYDLVITDLGMSGLSGWELADALHKLYPDVRVVMATGWGADLDRENLAAHHVDGLIGKPFKVDEILRVIESILTIPREEVLVD